MHNEIEHGFGCSGLVPTKAELEQEAKDAEIFRLRNEVALLRKALQDIANGAKGGETAIRALSARC